MYVKTEGVSSPLVDLPKSAEITRIFVSGGHDQRTQALSLQFVPVVNV
jgi:hypothetical protein